MLRQGRAARSCPNDFPANCDRLEKTWLRTLEAHRRHRRRHGDRTGDRPPARPGRRVADAARPRPRPARGDGRDARAADARRRRATSATGARSRRRSPALPSELGPIHALVACSGLGGANGGDAGADRFDDLVATNLNGTYYCCRAALAHLAPGPEPRHLVVMSSILARIAVPDYTGYSASKAGLLGLVRSLAAELGADNVQVNAICPGWVDTDMAWRGLDGIAAVDGRNARGRLPRRDARRAARAHGAAGRRRRHRRLAALPGRARRHRAGDRPERRRLDGIAGRRVVQTRL